MRHCSRRHFSVAILLLLSVVLTNCGPVSFSAKGSSFSVDPTNPGTTPADPTTPGDTTDPSVTPLSNTRDVVLLKTVQPYDNQVDILLVVDDSSSMLADNLRLASKLESFVQALSTSGLNWQMCITNTSPVTPAGSQQAYYGYSFNWALNGQDVSRVMTSSTPNKLETFTDTIKDSIGAGWEGTQDERGVLAAAKHLYSAPANNCYRNGAAQSVIIISDEDERSVAGDASQLMVSTVATEPTPLPLEAGDLPANYIKDVKAAFGNSKKLTVNSIIVKPGDTTCKNLQDKDLDDQGLPSFSHYGTKYAELSSLTNGFVGSICDNDFSTNLNYFKEKIQNSMAQVALECAPVGAVSLTVYPSIATPSYRVDGTNLIFEPAIPENHNITVNYKCSK